MLVLDLSRPQELWHTYQTCFDAIAKRVKHCISEASKQNPALKEKLKESILRRIGNAVSVIRNHSRHSCMGHHFRIRTKWNLCVFQCWSSARNTMCFKYFADHRFVLPYSRSLGNGTRGEEIHHQDTSISGLLSRCLSYGNEHWKGSEHLLKFLRPLLVIQWKARECCAFEIDDQSFLVRHRIIEVISGAQVWQEVRFVLFSKQPQIEYQKPLFVKSGSETSDRIGPPPVPEYELGDIREKYDHRGEN